MEKRLLGYIEKSRSIVFFGGAGVSTASGIPDFRSNSGIYGGNYDYPPETILSRDFFYTHTEEFYKFYRNKMIYTHARPNAAHIALATLEKSEKVKGVVTQNIDGLHQMAGSKKVFELHGSVHRNYCLKCKKSYSLDFIMATNGVALCGCSGIIKPDVVLYGEQLDMKILEAAVKAIQTADMLIVGGTSLTVYPAAGLIDYFKGETLVLINTASTPADSRADLVLREGLAEVLCC